MRRTILFSLRVLTAAALAGCLPAHGQPEDRVLPRSAGQIRSPQLRSHVSPERRKVLVGRLLAQVDPADVDGAITAVELLGEAPQVFVGEAVSRLRQSAQFERVFAVASEEQKGIFRSSALINRVGLVGDRCLADAGGAAEARASDRA